MELSLGAVLNRIEIKQLCQGATPLIVLMEEKNLKGASYDLRLGKYARVGRTFYDLDKDEQTLRIPPYEVAYVETEEALHMPNNLVATFGLRMAWVFRGLIVPPQTQIDPGYNGKIFILLFNLSNTDIFIGRNEHIISIEFRRTHETAVLDSPRQNVWSLTDALRGVPPVESGLAALAKDVRDWRQRAEVILLIVLAIVTLLLTILTVVPFLKEIGNLKDGEEKKEAVNVPHSVPSIPDTIPGETTKPSAPASERP